MSEDTELVAYIVSTITGTKDFNITRVIDERGVLITLNINQRHIGRVLGKNGSTAQAIRTLLRALGTKNDARYSLKICERSE